MGVTLCLSVFFSLFTGSFLSLLITKWFKVKIEYILSLCAGVLCGVLFLELIPHSMSEYNTLTVILGTLIGLPSMFFVDRLTHNHHSFNQKLDKTASFYFLLLAITLHNVPAGIALGNHADHDGHLFEIIVFHHIPEGMTLMMIYLASALKIHQLFLSFLFLSLSLNVFAFVGNAVLISNGFLLGMLLGLAISTFIYIAIFELFLPSLKVGFPSFHWLSLLTGIFLASIILIIG